MLDRMTGDTTARRATGTSGTQKLKKAAWLVSLVGLFLFIVVIGYQGIGPISHAVAAVGWGLVWISLFHLVPLLIDTYAWQFLLDKRHRVGFIELTRIGWIGEAVNSLLPVALIGGGLARTRLLRLAGVPVDVGGASVVGDLTVAVISLIFFSLTGVAVLVVDALPGYSSAQLLPGLLFFALVAYLFYLAQRRGMFLALARRIERLNGNDAAGDLSDDAAKLDQRVGELYERRRQFWFACLVRLVGWVAGSGEVWLALYYLGHRVTLAEAFMLESLGQAIRSAAFMVPGALGIQEGAYLVLGASIGIPPQLGVALSLVKRVRELSFGVPGLLAWQGQELRWLRRSSEQGPKVFEEGK